MKGRIIKAQIRESVLNRAPGKVYYLIVRPPPIHHHLLCLSLPFHQGTVEEE